jgi:hypothetical protein
MIQCSDLDYGLKTLKDIRKSMQQKMNNLPRNSYF